MITPPSPDTGLVVSDLHIFSCASLYKHKLPEFFEAASRYNTIVLNGDIFDFKRSIFQSVTETTAQAVDWLRDLCARFPNTSFYYLLGNHDSHPEFVTQATAFAANQANLQIVHDSILLGSALFLHGDVIDLPEGSCDLGALRQRYADARPNILSKVFAQIVTYTRLNVVEYARHRKSTLARSIVEYLRATQPDHLAQAKQIFFGHTHVAFRDFTFNGIQFHNTGSLVRGLKWLPMEFKIN
jgi:UDP-2,3-diacylglucosamine pyrophosphatase LpxH